MSRKRANVPPRDDWPSVQQAVRDLQAQIDGLVRAQGSQPSVPNTSDVVREVLGLLNTTTTAPGTTAGLSFGIPPVAVGFSLSEGTALNPARADHVHTMGRLRVRSYNVGAQSLTSGVPTALTMDSEEFDPSAMHDVSSNSSRITFATAGTYLVGGATVFDINGTGTRSLRIFINGTSQVTGATGPGSASVVTRLSVATLFSFVATDYIEILGFQDSGGALNVLGSSSQQSNGTHMWAVGPFN